MEEMGINKLDPGSMVEPGETLFSSCFVDLLKREEATKMLRGLEHLCYGDRKHDPYLSMKPQHQAHQHALGICRKELQTQL